MQNRGPVPLPLYAERIFTVRRECIGVPVRPYVSIVSFVSICQAFFVFQFQYLYIEGEKI